MSIETQKINFKNLDIAYDVLIKAMKYDEVVKTALLKSGSNIKILNFVSDNIGEEGVVYHSTPASYYDAQIARAENKLSDLNNSIRLTAQLNLSMRCLFNIIDDRYEILYEKDYLKYFMTSLDPKHRDFLFYNRRVSLNKYEFLVHKGSKKKLSMSEDHELAEALYNNYEAVRFFYSEGVRTERLVIPELKLSEAA